MGVIYKEDLLDYEESIKSFKELIERYPDTEYGAPVYYYLYELSNNIQKPSEADLFASQLSVRYPESHFAKLLNNPNYLKELEEEEMKVVRAYEELYEQYRRGAYSQVIDGAERSMLQWPDDPLIPKYQYLRAMALGTLEGREAMKVALDTLIAQYPETEEGLQAQEIVDYMYVEFPEILQADQAAEGAMIYTDVDSAQEHFFILAVHTSQNVNQVNFDLLNHNLDHYNQYDLSLVQLEFSDSYNILVVSPFNNAEGASRYLQDIDRNRDIILKEMDPTQSRMMIISKENYGTLSESKEIIPYYLFYQNRYLIQE
jgi:hypothetical protein